MKISAILGLVVALLLAALVVSVGVVCWAVPSTVVSTPSVFAHLLSVAAEYDKQHDTCSLTWRVNRVDGLQVAFTWTGDGATLSTSSARSCSVQVTRFVQVGVDVAAHEAHGISLLVDGETTIARDGNASGSAEPLNLTANELLRVAGAKSVGLQFADDMAPDGAGRGLLSVRELADLQALVSDLDKGIDSRTFVSKTMGLVTMPKH